ncbi:MAG: hypothetical protein QXR30_03795 [Candidatus Woesearchaeota archaeon]
MKKKVLIFTVKEKETFILITKHSFKHNMYYYLHDCFEIPNRENFNKFLSHKILSNQIKFSSDENLNKIILNDLNTISNKWQKCLSKNLFFYFIKIQNYGKINLETDRKDLLRKGFIKKNLVLFRRNSLVVNNFESIKFKNMIFSVIKNQKMYNSISININNIGETIFKLTSKKLEYDKIYKSLILSCDLIKI